MDWMKFGNKKNKAKMTTENTNESVNENPESAETQEQQDLPNVPGDEKDEKIAELEEQVAAINDKHLRLYAEFDNFKRRTSKERLELLQIAGKDVIVDLLPVLDDFERAQKSIIPTAETANIVEGINLIQTKLQKTLESKGLNAMDTIADLSMVSPPRNAVVKALPQSPKVGVETQTPRLVAVESDDASGALVAAQHVRIIRASHLDHGL